jgi:hypothetical protein
MSSGTVGLRAKAAKNLLFPANNINEGPLHLATKGIGITRFHARGAAMVLRRMEKFSAATATWKSEIGYRND